MRTSLAFVIPFLACTLGLAACSDDSSDGAAGAAGSQPGNDAAAGSAGAAGAAGSAGMAGAAGGAGEDAGTDASVEIDGAAGATGEDAAVDSSVGPVSSCSELSTTDCFSNLDCPAERRCQNAGTELDPVPCCVPGARGTGAAGTACTLELDCESAVCIEGLCSKTCTQDEDCPAGMKSCIPIAFSGSDDNWCFPVK